MCAHFLHLKCARIYGPVNWAISYTYKNFCFTFLQFNYYTTQYGTSLQHVFFRRTFYETFATTWGYGVGGEWGGGEVGVGGGGILNANIHTVQRVLWLQASVSAHTTFAIQFPPSGVNLQTWRMAISLSTLTLSMTSLTWWWIIKKYKDCVLAWN